MKACVPTIGVMSKGDRAGVARFASWIRLVYVIEGKVNFDEFFGGMGYRPLGYTCISS